MPDQEAYLALANKAEQIRMAVIEANAEADKLGVQTPLTIADLMVWPDRIRAAFFGDPQADWLTSMGYERSDEEPEP